MEKIGSLFISIVIGNYIRLNNLSEFFVMYNNEHFKIFRDF